MAAEPLDEVRNHLSDIIDRVEIEHERVTVTRDGRAVAVILSPDDLAELEESLAVLSDPQALADIREADAAFAAGDVVRGVDAVRALRPRATALASVPSSAALWDGRIGFQPHVLGVGEDFQRVASIGLERQLHGSVSVDAERGGDGRDVRSISGTSGRQLHGQEVPQGGQLDVQPSRSWRVHGATRWRRDIRRRRPVQPVLRKAQLGRHRADHARDHVIGRHTVDVLRTPTSIGQLQGYRRAPDEVDGGRDAVGAQPAVQLIEEFADLIRIEVEAHAVRSSRSLTRMPTLARPSCSVRSSRTGKGAHGCSKGVGATSHLGIGRPSPALSLSNW